MFTAVSMIPLYELHKLCKCLFDFSIVAHRLWVIRFTILSDRIAIVLAFILQIDFTPANLARKFILLACALFVEDKHFRFHIISRFRLYFIYLNVL